LTAAFWLHCENYYRTPDGKPTSEQVARMFPYCTVGAFEACEVPNLKRASLAAEGTPASSH
jgi:hypothetical protein